MKGRDTLFAIEILYSRTASLYANVTLSRNVSTTLHIRWMVYRRILYAWRNFSPP